MDGEECPALTSSSRIAQAYQALTDTATPDTARPVAIISGKRNSNLARPEEGQAASPRLPANPDSNVTSAASFGESDGNSEYVESAGNVPTSSAITLDLAGHIRELETIHEV